MAAAAAAALATTFDAPPSWPNGRPPLVFSTESKWDQIFASFTLDHQIQEKYAETISVLKEEAKMMLTMAKGKSLCERLVLIDTLERLGVGYHFEQEIEDQLELTLTEFEKEREDYDLFTTALWFRLLRQHRHYVSCNVFDKFIDQQDKRFKETLGDDAKGLLSLYEAAHLSIHGERILNEAVTFTVHHLKRMERQLESPLQDLVKRALEQPLHRGLARIETRYYIDSYEKDDSRSEQLLKLAKLDFNYLQNMYKNELQEITRWWNKLKPNLPYGRNRIVASYLWATSFHFEPQWNMDEMDGLSNELKLMYDCAIKFYDEYEDEAATQGTAFAVPYAKEAVKELCWAHSQGLKYTMGGPMASFEDYILNSVIGGVIYATYPAAFLGLKSASQETIDWLRSKPSIIRASALVCRYLDDLGSYQRESQNGMLLTGFDFYVKHHGGSVQEAKDKFVELAEDAWISFNTEWIANVRREVPKEVAEVLLGYVRAADVFYRNNRDGFAKCHAMAPEVGIVAATGEGRHGRRVVVHAPGDLQCLLCVPWRRCRRQVVMVAGGDMVGVVSGDVSGVAGGGGGLVAATGRKWRTVETEADDGGDASLM
ncbi:Alpha-humulene/(-)-(E)-beta-caryophyllene synthase [Striga hermonthica]|uniref:Alpha-humulene/(-)-(E)-beta-caryophyllene synthase n=1 Tax=Striga hermonthica TaxID=68872 RepID=A0A9N7MJA4_STRHE|nr:Alpha-humulene/(-)-(E)-beta-caryophyllene synthase [Striga hermonthica]